MARHRRTTILSLLLLLTYQPLKSELTTCPTSNGYVHDVTSGLCVILLPGWVARDAAKTTCEDRGDRLLWLDTALEETFFRGFARTDGNSFWLGGYRTTPSSWRWSGNDQLCHTNWSPDQPDGTGDCMAIASWYDWQWDDVPCTQHMRIACEKLTVTSVRGCGQMNSSTPNVISPTAPVDAVSSRTEVTSTSPSSSSPTRSEVTLPTVSRTKQISGTSESTDDVMYMPTASSTTPVSTGLMDLDTDRPSTDITLRGSLSIALSSKTVTMPESQDASSTILDNWESEIERTQTYTRVLSVESDGYRMETDVMSSSYVIESRASSVYIGDTIDTSGSSINSTIRFTASSSSIVDSRVHTTASSSSTVDSSVKITTSSSTVGSSVHTTASNTSTVDSSVKITTASSSTIDSNVQITSSSSSVTDPSVQITPTRRSTTAPSIQITSSSSSIRDPGVQITASSAYVMSTLTGSVLETNSDNAFSVTDDTGKTSVASPTSVISDSPNPPYAISTLPSPTQTAVTTSLARAPCRCFCEPKHRYKALRLEELQQRKEEVRDSLLLDKRGLAKFEARYTSADDQRHSSFTIASVGMAILVACGCLIILSDVINLVRPNTKKNTHK